MHTFKKMHRLLKKQDFDAVFKKPLKVSNRDFTFLFKKNAEKHARIGFALSKKIINKACDRNSIKRILRESFRLKTDLPAVDIVVLAKSSLLYHTPHEIRTNLDSLWHTLSERYKL